MSGPYQPVLDANNIQMQRDINALRTQLERLESFEYQTATTSTSEKAWTFSSPPGASGIFYYGGYYIFASGNNDFSPLINFGSANSAYGAHFLIVLGEATVDELTIRVSGTSINDEGTRMAADSQDIVIPSGTLVDSYYETSKKWIGQVSIEAVSGTPKQCNYGLSKYWDNNNSDFSVVGVDVTWLSGANDSGIDIELLHHKTTGWTYNAGAEPTPPVAICSMADDYVTENNAVNGEEGAYKRTNLNTPVSGSGSEGTIIRITSTANKAFVIGNYVMRINA